jgi:glycosyltransferase involved in cell wall biosynthesis
MSDSGARGTLNLFAVGFYPPRNVTGAERSGWNTARQLAKRGHRIKIFTEAFGGSRAPIAPNIETVHVETTRHLDIRPEDYALAASIRRGLSAGDVCRHPLVTAIDEGLRQQRPDAILVNWGAPFTSFALGVAGGAGIPVITVLHGSDVHALDRTEFRNVRNAVLRSYRAAHARIAVADYLRDALRGMGVCDVTTIRNAIDLDEFGRVTDSEAAQERASLGIPEDAVVFAHVSNLRPVKDPLRIVEAAVIALKEREDLHFLIVGDGPLAPELKRVVRERHVHHKFTFTGKVSAAAVARYLRVAQAHVMSSVREGTPLVILEALAIGRPTIASRVGGIPEIVRHGENGLLYEPGDVVKFAEHMLELTDVDAWKRLSRGAIRTARRHSIEELGRSYEKVIRRAIRARHDLAGSARIGPRHGGAHEKDPIASMIGP